MTFHKKVKRLTADQALAFLVLLGEKATLGPLPQPDQVANPSTIAALFAGCLIAWQDVNASGSESLTDENLSLVTAAMNTAENAMLALPARDATYVWRKVAVALRGCV